MVGRVVCVFGVWFLMVIGLLFEVVGCWAICLWLRYWEYGIGWLRLIVKRARTKNNS